MMLMAPTSLTSATTAHIFDVPMSSPTIIEEDLNMFSLGSSWFWGFGRRRSGCSGFVPANGNIVGNRQVQGGDLSGLLRCQVMHRAPAPELPLEILGRKNDLVSLAGCHLQYRR